MSSCEDQCSVNMSIAIDVLAEALADCFGESITAAQQSAIGAAMIYVGDKQGTLISALASAAHGLANINSAFADFYSQATAYYAGTFGYESDCLDKAWAAFVSQIQLIRLIYLNCIGVNP